MSSIYSYLKSFTDPVVILLLLIGTGLWIMRDLRKERSRRLGWWTSFAGFIVFYLLSILPVVMMFVYILEKDYMLNDSHGTPEIEVVVVLGGGTLKRGMESEVDPSAETASRLIFGLQTLKQSKVKYFILSGGGGGSTSEAEVMARIVEQLVEDTSGIIIESSSRNTWEQAKEVDKLLDNKEMSIGIVTSALHMKRSLMVFNRYFHNATPLPSSFLYSAGKITLSDFMPNSQMFYRSSAIMHEYIGLLWYYIKEITGNNTHENTTSQSTV